MLCPKDSLFSDQQQPVSASVILTIKPGSDFRDNRQKVEGVEKLILFAVEGLAQESLTISDSSGVRLNDFSNFADFDRLEQTKEEIKIKNNVETQYKEAIHKALADIYTPDRVRIVNINVDIDFNKKTQTTTENYPIVVKQDNPTTPFDETEVTLAIPRSTKSTLQKYTGTGFNPEGPPGVEGQTPPSYQDLDGIVGDWDNRTTVVNNEINQKVTEEERNYDVLRIAASVAIDGTWEKNYDDLGNLIVENNGKISRTYSEVSAQDLQKAQSLVRSAVGYIANRGDSVSVENIPFDRSEFFALEDAAYLRSQRNRLYAFYGVIGLVGIILLLIIIRIIVRVIERYKIYKEEKLAEQYRRTREQQMAALSQSQDQKLETELERMVRETGELIKQDPANIANLIRAWVREP